MERWSGVQLRHLAALIAVDDERSFRGAADRLGYVQSAVSQQIASLERSVGSRLVERASGHSSVALTDAGTIVVDHARVVLAQLDAAFNDLRAMVAGANESISVGAAQSLASQFVPHVLSRMSARCPDIPVTTRETLSDAELFEAVRSSGLDAAIAELPLDGGRFEGRELFIDPTVLIVPADWPLAFSQSEPTLQELADLDLIAHASWRMMPLLESEFEVAGARPRFVRSALTDSGVQSLVRSGLGAALVPRLSVDMTDPRIRAITMDSLPSRKVVVFWEGRRRESRSLALFVESARAACRQLDLARPSAESTRTATTSDTVALPDTPAEPQPIAA